ncbi:MAG: Crp/Fnr family transcriptional regulator [Chitinophagaceae bacterium]|nr:Crp/Fnr family transcriptional regulator [Chitinophagaceae bacterium]
MYQSAITFLQAKGLKSKELKDHLHKILKQDAIKKKARLLQINEVCERVWFIEKGSFRGFLRSKGRQKNEWFMKEGDVMFAPLSVYTGEPSEVAIEALEDSIVHSISIRQLELIYQRYLPFNIIGRKLTEEYYMRSLQNADLLRESTIRARYLRFLKLYHDLDERVPALHIASFLGCSEEAFNRVRKKINRK